jgi:NAD(P)-dependent dehydrogenase (short-subunit alcohol dehydrogenase family)
MLAVSLADRFITCNAIAPGPFPSKMMEHTLETMGDEIRAAVPLKRIGQASDIAGTAIFLASAAGAYVTGAVIPLDGGTVAAGRSL